MGFWRDLFKSKEEKIREKQKIVKSSRDLLLLKNRFKLEVKQNKIPLLKARNTLVDTLSTFERKRDELDLKWKVAYPNFSWWNKLKYDENLDLSELNKQISQLEIAIDKFDSKYHEKLTKLYQHFERLEKTSSQRIERSYNKLLSALDGSLIKDLHNDSINAAWLAALSVPFSIANDLSAADQVYNSLRAVNGNFEDMTNSQIWWETLWMSPESLAGLSSLVKGAYFEQLVANDMGGQLHEHFNTPETDMLLDGMEFQLKATGSVAYINSVDEDIPIISTSEVAIQTDAIDSGYSNDELTTRVEQALDGGLIDAKDVAVDALLTGVGSLGIFATMRGINHASAKYDEGVEAEEAFLDGLGVAIEGTAKGIVDAGEMLYKVAMSRPSRFVGRSLVKGFEKLDEKLMEEPSKEKSK